MYAVLDRRTDSADEACSRFVGLWTYQVDQAAADRCLRERLSAATVFKKSSDISTEHASDMQLSLSSLESSSSNSLDRMSSDLSPDIKSSRIR